ncbi:MAG: F0F1 ATP synthase subunit A [Candidatus Pacebacteria bacterium]|nr:F0F1 ATP synthase subunit A [Candidatus Paceibacterota bacterium]
MSQTLQTENIPSQEIHHETTLFAEPVFNLGGFTVTNSLLCSWIAVFLVVIFSLLVRKKISLIPKGIQSYFEVFLEGSYNLADTVTGSRQKTMKFLPVVLPLFAFILFSNWLGLLPGVGSVGFVSSHNGQSAFVPLLRGGTADLNTTLALSVLAVFLTHIFGTVMAGWWSHLNRFVGLNLFLELPRKVFKERNYQALLINPIKFFVGLIEAVGELAKVASLSFRLFGNVFAGEVLLASMAAIFAYVVPLPFIFLEIIVGIIQALIFSMLILVFLSIMSSSHAEEH